MAPSTSFGTRAFVSPIRLSPTRGREQSIGQAGDWHTVGVAVLDETDNLIVDSFHEVRVESSAVLTGKAPIVAVAVGTAFAADIALVINRELAGESIIVHRSYSRRIRREVVLRYFGAEECRPWSAA